jgi:4-hydroxy-3-polyprenylbenzoate decarboxylase
LKRSPALLFENIVGHPGHRVLINVIGSSVPRLCLTIGEQPVDHPLQMIELLKKKMGKKIPPREVPQGAAICNQCIATGDDIDLTRFPAPFMWPLDGGPYLGTSDAVITSDPETGRVNVGTYRMMIKGPRELGLYTSPGKDGTVDRDKWWRMGKPMPIVAAFGIDPLLFLVGATSFPKTESEYDFFGGLAGRPMEIFRSDVTGLPVPARAEIVVEGFVHPGDTFPEGPFGEFTGYYAREGDNPYVRIEKVRFRENPTLTCALANEPALLWSSIRASAIWADLDRIGVPGIRGVWCIPEAAGAGITVVSLRQMYAGHASQVMTLAAQCTGGAYFAKYVIVVDDDVDPTDTNQVLWAMATRSRPAQSIEILRETWNTFLDPSLNPPEIRPWGSKCLINACMEHRHIQAFSKRCNVSRPHYERVVERWSEVGFDDKPPLVTVFESRNELFGDRAASQSSMEAAPVQREM